MKKIEFVNTAFLGDRLVDTARFLGFHPTLMATAHTPMLETKMPVSRQIECTACVLGAESNAFFGTAKKMGINKILLEKNNYKGEVDASEGEGFIRDLGFEVEVLDFTQGIETAVKETGRALGIERKASVYIEKYNKSLEKASSLLPANLDKRILVLLGLVHRDYDNEFLLVEEAGGVDDFIINPSGCINVSKYIGPDDEQKEKQEIRVVNGLSGIIEAAPDMIALTCEAGPGLKALNRIASECSEVRNIPAIKNQAVFSLPHCAHAEPMERPYVLEAWADVLARIK